MKFRLLSILLSVTILVSAINAVPICAQTNHSLQWGVEVGYEARYVLQRKVLDPSFGSYLTDYAPFIAGLDVGQSLIARVTHLDPIPAMINESSQMPRSNCTLIRMNDSEVIMEDMFMLVVPVGDWSFTSEMSNFSFFEDASNVETDDEWGTVIDTTFVFALFPVSVYMEMLYEKTNGTMKNMRMRVNFAGNDIIDLAFAKWYPGIPLILPGEIQLGTIIAVSLVGVVGTVLTFFGYRRYKRKKVLVQESGG
ncbi:MAG: hypothetical protein ACFFD9_04500 [Candidatus Thorarchaeota archaeon]